MFSGVAVLVGALSGIQSPGPYLVVSGSPPACELKEFAPPFVQPGSWVWAPAVSGRVLDVRDQFGRPIRDAVAMPPRVAEALTKCRIETPREWRLNPVVPEDRSADLTVRAPNAIDGTLGPNETGIRLDRALSVRGHIASPDTSVTMTIRSAGESARGKSSRHFEHKLRIAAGPRSPFEVAVPLRENVTVSFEGPRLFAFRIETPSSASVVLPDLSVNAPPVTGVVLGPGGHPAPSVRVRAGPSAGVGCPIVFSEVVTSRDGHFSIVAPWMAPLTLCASLSDGPMTLVQMMPPADVVLTLAQWRTVSGRVVGADGAAVEGARVSLAAHQPGEPPKVTANSVKDGTFKLQSVAPGQYSLTVRKDGHAIYTREGIDVQTLDVDLDPIELRPAGSLRGVVLDRFGAPMPSVRVVAYDSLDGELCSQSTSDVDGRFTLGGLSPGYLDLRISANEVDVWSRNRFEMTDESGDLGEIVVEPRTASVAGRVLSRGGLPATGREVRILSRGPNRSGERITTVLTDEAGRFFVSDLLEGPATVFSGRPSEGLREIGRLALLAGETSKIEAVEAGVRLRGRLAGAERELSVEILQEHGIASSGTTPSSRSAGVDFNGNFDLGEVAAGPSRLVVRSRDGRAVFFESVDVPDRADHWFEMMVASVRGRVVDPSGRGIASASVTSSSVDSEFPAEGVVVTESDGTFELVSKLGRKRLRVRSSQGSGEATVDIPSGGELTIAVDLGLEVSARVFDPHGLLVNDATVYLAADGLLAGTGLASDITGVFRGRTSRPDAIFVARRSGFWGAQPVSMDTTVDIILRPCRAVVITVVDRLGQPLSGVHVGVSSSKGARLPITLFRGLTDTLGKMAIEVPDDDIEVTVLGPHGGGQWPILRGSGSTTIVAPEGLSSSDHAGPSAASILSATRK